MRSVDNVSLADSLSAPDEEEIRRLLGSSSTSTHPFSSVSGSGSGDSRTICPSVDSAAAPPPPPGGEDDFELLRDDAGTAGEVEIEARVPDSLRGRGVAPPPAARDRETVILPEAEKLDRILAALAAIRDGIEGVGAREGVRSALYVCDSGLASDPAPSQGTAPWVALIEKLKPAEAAVGRSDRAPGAAAGTWPPKKLGPPLAALALAPALIILSVRSGAAKSAETCDAARREVLREVTALRREHEELLGEVRGVHSLLVRKASAAARGRVREGRREAGIEAGLDQVLSEVADVAEKVGGGASLGCLNGMALFSGDGGPSLSEMAGTLDRILEDLAHLKNSTSVISDSPQGAEAGKGIADDSSWDFEDRSHKGPMGEALQKNSDEDAGSFEDLDSPGNTVRSVKIQASSTSDSSSRATRPKEAREETVLAAAKSFGGAFRCIRERLFNPIALQGLVECPLVRKLPEWPLGPPTLLLWADWSVALALLSLCWLLWFATARWCAATGEGTARSGGAPATPNPVGLAEPPAGRRDGEGDSPTTGLEEPAAKEAGTRGNGPEPVARVLAGPSSGLTSNRGDPSTTGSKLPADIQEETARSVDTNVASGSVKSSVEHRDSGKDLPAVAPPVSNRLAPERRNKRKKRAGVSAAATVRRVKISYAVADDGAAGLGPAPGPGPGGPFPPLLPRGFAVFNGADPAPPALGAVLRAAAPGLGVGRARLWCRTGPASLRRVGTAGATAGGDGWDLVDLGALERGGGDDEGGTGQRGGARGPLTVAEWAARHRALPTPRPGGGASSVRCAEVLVEVRGDPPAPWPRSALELPRRIRVGDFVDARDGSGRWYEAVVRGVSHLEVKVHYLGWSSKWDAHVPRWPLGEGGRGAATLPSGRRGGGLCPPAPLWSRTPRWRDGIRLGDVVEVREAASPLERPRWFRAVVCAVGEDDPVHDVVGGAELETNESDDGRTLLEGEGNGSEVSGGGTLLLLGRTRQVLVEVPMERTATPALSDDSASSQGAILTPSYLNGEGTPIPLANPPYMRWINLYGEEICKLNTHNKVRSAD